MGAQPAREEMDAPYARGDEHRINGQYDEASQIRDSILEADPGHVQARHEKALALCYSGLFDESIAEFERVREEAPDFLQARNNLGLTYAMLGMNDEAKAEFQFVLARDPNNEVALKNIVYFQ